MGMQALRPDFTPYQFCNFRVTLLLIAFVTSSVIANMEYLRGPLITVPFWKLTVSPSRWYGLRYPCIRRRTLK
jgi:hypothetical protein